MIAFFFSFRKIIVKEGVDLLIRQNKSTSSSLPFKWMILFKNYLLVDVFAIHSTCQKLISGKSTQHNTLTDWIIPDLVLMAEVLTQGLEFSRQYLHHFGISFQQQCWDLVFVSSRKEVQHFFHISVCPCQWEGNFLAKLSNQKFYSWIILLNLHNFFKVILYISLTLSPSFISSINPQRKAAADSVQSGKLVLATLK